MKQYFLFGEDASIIFNREHDSLQDKAIAINNVSYDVYAWDEFETPTSLLECYTGWWGYELISEELYNLLNKR
jgi:hypothetical protein